ncbi:MAG TPA: hypothetical protein VEA78_09915 [Acidimicrobiales bacterium]|nr:hypothetical protein [Acidimicrobiales bacterium]
MATYLWPGDPGWPSPSAEEDDAVDVVDLDAEIDLDALSLHVPPPHLLDDVTPLELAVLRGRFGLDGEPVRSVRRLHDELHVSEPMVRHALDSGLAKLRAHLT